MIFVPKTGCHRRDPSPGQAFSGSCASVFFEFAARDARFKCAPGENLQGAVAMKDLKIELHETEQRLLTELRTLRRGLRGTGDGSRSGGRQLTIGQRIADAVAATMGSWTFIIIQSVLLLFWIALNVTAYVQQWDPYPFILLNLSALVPSRLCRALHHDEPESPARHRSQVGRGRFQDQHQGRA